ncbi:hypothetical protein LCGC14_1498680 [marine sediment metagenome]|uniref:Uncharacterized protein n=1 Tax=marine sediment metagenome TaxID=412755 RepID=A0A0F9M646_9ZZZZ
MRCTRLKTIKQIPIPIITNNQRVNFSILCAMEVYIESEWTTWANNWLSGKNRTNAAAYTAAEIANTKASVCIYATVDANAAYSAAYAAFDAANVGRQVPRAYAANAAAYAVKNKKLSLIKLAKLAQQ